MYKYSYTAPWWLDTGKPDMGSNYIDYWLFNQMGLYRGQKSDR